MIYLTTSKGINTKYFKIQKVADETGLLRKAEYVHVLYSEYIYYLQRVNY